MHTRTSPTDVGLRKRRLAPLALPAWPALLALVVGAGLAAPPAVQAAPVAAAGSAAAPTGEASASHPFAAIDMLSMLRVSQPQASPRGDWVAFVVQRPDFAANSNHTDLWIVGGDGSGERALTTDGAGYDNPRWAADGSALYFLSRRSGNSQIWRLAAAQAGQAAPQFEQVTRLPVEVTSFQLTPDAAHAVVSADVFPDCPNLGCTHDRLETVAKSTVKARFFPDGTGFVRHWDTWEDGTRSHLFAVALGDGGAAPIDLMHGMQGDAPSKPEGGPEEYAVSPDGRTVVFAVRLAGRGEPWSTNFDLYSVPLDGSQAPRDLTATNPAWDSFPVFSPDGRTLAYGAQTRPADEADRFHLVLRDLASGQERRIAEEWDRSVGPLLFSADGRTLFTTTSDMGQNPVFAIDVATGHVRKLPLAGHVAAPGLAGSNRLVVTMDDLRHPAEVYTLGTDGSAPVQITHLNRQRLATVRMGDFEQFHFAGAGGETVYGWVVKPADLAPGKRYPTVLIIHGGPESAMDNHFHYRWNPEVYAGAGYGVVFIDFHGTPGYGQAFVDSIAHDWGGKPFVDLQLGLAAAVARYPWMDGERACDLGASFGGFMTNWIEGNWPDRFRCAVTHDGVFDQRMMYYATEELWFPEYEEGAPEFQAPEAYEKWNPVRFVDRWKTPMLVVHSDLDFRIPLSQGLGAYTALRRRGVPSEFLEFPNENHWVLKPADSLLWHQTVLSWLARWLNPPTGTPVAQ